MAALIWACGTKLWSSLVGRRRLASDAGIKSYLETPRGDLSSDWHRAMLRSRHVDLLQLHHDLTDDVIPRVTVKAQHDKVKSQ